MQPLLPVLAAAATLAGMPALADDPDEPAGFGPAIELSFDNTGTGKNIAPAPARTGPATVSTQGRPSLSGSADWTGFYVGGQLGIALGDSDLDSNDESLIGGITLGYDHDFGSVVFGGALDYDFTDFDVAPGTSVEEIFRVKVRGGPKLGNGLLYAAAGWANADTDNAGNDDGWFIGGGYEYMVNSRWSLGGELLYHEFDSFNGTGNDVEATSIQVRATFRF